MHIDKKPCHAFGIISVVPGIIAFGFDCYAGWIMFDESDTLDELGGHALGFMIMKYAEIAVSVVGCVLASIALFTRALLAGGIGLGTNAALAGRTVAMVYFGAM
ncbi:MAG: hypothetical protein ACYS8Z_10120 [Planctomycetota bacterium]|jgi:hypothetical protein